MARSRAHPCLANVLLPALAAYASGVLLVALDHTRPTRSATASKPDFAYSHRWAKVNVVAARSSDIGV
ncbi:hypothetical protein GCM10010503_43740 [Streptomyces lucensis JCM 4490]|uniref:Uncharacterized protein n=1 Tax=Streptomyces lucensis JCM 4490 TaxID=1306176 RepID=A0A918J8Q8_9ACTN|nr:hypothetical protein [Streptomyces lucensis]GGW61871.1 hypothetical protein GCM10010503_43740 [Streptomyces lucensis JCM 4490]